jgi:CarD family transcriptional regulator
VFQTSSASLLCEKTEQTFFVSPERYFSMRFAIGDLIFYGESGVCRVEEIVQKEFLGELRACYRLSPIYQSCTIFTPADNEAVFMRNILSRNEAQAIIDSIGTIEPEISKTASPRELTERYDKMIKTHDCNEYLKFIVSFHKKKKLLSEQKKKVSAIDERFLKKAEDLLYGELAAALEMDKIATKLMIQERVQAL